MQNKIKLNDIKILFFFIPCVVPAMLLKGGITKLLFNGWRVVAFLMIICCLFTVRHKISKILIYSSIFSAVIILSTYLNNGVLKSSISIAMMMFTIIALSEIQIQKDPARYFHIIGGVSWIILLFDTMQIFTGIGLDRSDNSTWLGGDNFAIFTVFPMLGIIVLNDAFNYGRIRNITIIFCILAALAKLKTFAVTSILAFAFLAICLFWGRRVDISERIKWILISIAIILLICLCADFSNIYMKFAALFGKEPHIEHSRIAIWKLSIKAILNEPIIGHGVLESYEESIAIAGEYWPTCSHTHNYILELLFRSGIIGTTAYILMLKNCFKAIVQKLDNGIMLLLKAFLMANLVLWITESYYAQAPVYVLLVLVSHMELISKYKLTTKKPKLLFK